ncbi:UDP-glucose 4-epimerase [Pseudomonas sp. NFIX10]|uniref:NAD-dependent epimerase/dehydratase family protein n=1 Tax=unclassified Pseudomonas TaxID=196821 RepID=UPI0008E56A49|nr:MULTISPECIES: NAD-dependent epimerase/dehydratase family protein [unclassified Pseudomonas]SFA70495.1 UDP-glucose 4-epimerase [Pseudomonas sp. NFIX10]SFE07232.1 UDP-glucose 4-epimerase [Pseudomonas sp. NFACC06-1]
MKILIFGGGGFIGSAIADRLLADGHSLRIFERPRVEPYRKFEPTESVEWVTGDLMSTHDVSEAVDGMDAVLHLVSTTLPKTSNDDPIYDVQTNLVATLQMLNAMVEKGISRILFISSGGTVYGAPNYLPVDEAHPTDPQVSYGITKLAIEKYILMYQHLHGIKATVLRVTNPYGERQRVETAQGAVGVFLSRALKNESIQIWGDGSVTRDYVYVSDVAEAFALALKYDGPHSVFNISSGSGVSINELIERIETVVGDTIDKQYLPGRPYDVPVSVLDNGLAARELKWAPKVRLEEGLMLTSAWMKRTMGK